MSVLAFVGFMLLLTLLGDSDTGCSCSCDHEERHYTDQELGEGLHLPDRDRDRF